MRTSVLEQIRKLDVQKAALIETAKKEVLSDAYKAIKTLKSLGHHFELVAKGGVTPSIAQPEQLRKKGAIKKSAKRKGSRVGTRKPADIACPICSFKTSPPHDRRSHRSQMPKKAFTQKELTAKGMKKVT